MQIVYSLSKVHQLDQGFLDNFIELCFKQYLENPDKSMPRVKTIIGFMMELAEKKQFDPIAKSDVWLYYLNEFKRVKAAKEFAVYLTNLSANPHGKGAN